MTTLNSTYVNALLADATYVHGIDPQVIVTDLKTALFPRMTLTLADYISTNFSVVTQIESGDIVGSGFDATVWRQTDGKLFVSMRGTEPGQDLFIADADLAFTGNARFQIVDMVNWWLREAGGARESVRQIRLGVGPNESTFADGAPAVGTGRITVADLVNGTVKAFSVEAAHLGLTLSDRAVAVSIVIYGTELDDRPVRGGQDLSLNGSVAEDEIRSLGGSDYIYGRAGNDLLYGGSRNDLIFGRAGDDVIEGSLDDDDLVGKADNDVLTGGDGNDILLGASAGGNRRKCGNRVDLCGHWAATNDITFRCLA